MFAAVHLYMGERINPEFRNLRKVSLKMLNKADFDSFSDSFSDDLNTINHFNMKLLIFRHPAISEVQDFGNFELSPIPLIILQT